MSSRTKPVSERTSLTPKINARGVAEHPVTSGASRPARYFWIAEVIRRRRQPAADTNSSTMNGRS
jgi:hypothetical protein